MADDVDNSAAAAAKPAWRRRGRFLIWIGVVVAASVAPIAWLWPMDNVLARDLAWLRGGWLTLSALPVLTWLLLATTPRDAILVSPSLGKRLIVATGLIAAAAGVDLVLPPSESAGEPADRWRAALASLPWWQRLSVWRLALGVAYIALLFDLCLWVRQRGLSVWAAGLAAWSPAAWFSATSLGLGGMIGAALFVAALRGADVKRRRRAAVLLALAVAALPTLLPIVPWLISPLRGGRWGRPPWAWFALASVALWVPALLIGGGLVGFGETLLAYVRLPGDTVAGGWFAFWPPFGWIVWLAITTAAAGVAWRRTQDVATVGYAAALASLLATPASATGLLVTALVTAPAMGRRAGLAALLAAGAAGWTLSPADASPALAASAWALVLGVAGLELLAASRRR